MRPPSLARLQPPQRPLRSIRCAAMSPPLQSLPSPAKVGPAALPVAFRGTPCDVCPCLQKLRACALPLSHHGLMAPTAHVLLFFTSVWSQAGGCHRGCSTGPHHSLTSVGAWAGPDQVPAPTAAAILAVSGGPGPGPPRQCLKWCAPTSSGCHRAAPLAVAGKGTPCDACPCLQAIRACAVLLSHRAVDDPHITHPHPCPKFFLGQGACQCCLLQPAHWLTIILCLPRPWPGLGPPGPRATSSR